MEEEARVVEVRCKMSRRYQGGPKERNRKEEQPMTGADAAVLGTLA